VKRAFDIFVSLVVMLFAGPLIMLSAIGVKIGAPGPAFYLARRVGRNGKLFDMIKLRTMYVASDRQKAITAPEDRRIFPFGRFLRASKIDELPQFWNVLVGDMSIVGPRPEDPGIVRDHYTDWMRETLAVRPGVTSPGAVFSYLSDDSLLEGEDIEQSYVAQILPKKLQIEYDYLQRATFWSDLGVVLQTAAAIVKIMFTTRKVN